MDRVEKDTEQSKESAGLPSWTISSTETAWMESHTSADTDTPAYVNTPRATPHSVLVAKIAVNRCLRISGFMGLGPGLLPWAWVVYTLNHALGNYKQCPVGYGT